MLSLGRAFREEGCPLPKKAWGWCVPDRVWEASRGLPVGRTEMKGAGVEAGEGNGGVGGIGDDMLSAIGSRVSANEEADALCGMETGPSAIDAFRACG